MTAARRRRPGLRGATRALAMAVALGAALLAGCASVPAIDTRYRAVSQGPRVDLLVIHCTALDFADSLRALAEQVARSHYLVDEDRRANHAGVSAWDRRTPVKPRRTASRSSTPGVNAPPTAAGATCPTRRSRSTPWSNGCATSCSAGASRRSAWSATPTSPPGRKQDPGPLFPWKRLADEGLAPWFDEARAAVLRTVFERQLPDVAWFQQRLARVGSLDPQDGQLDTATRNVPVSFQMRFRPARYDGEPDAETAAILAALTEG